MFAEVKATVSLFAVGLAAAHPLRRSDSVCHSFISINYFGGMAELIMSFFTGRCRN